MGKIRKIIGGMVKGPDRIDELADRITGLSKRLDEGGERIIVMESRVNELDVGWYMDKILDDRNVLLQSYDREYEAETVPISEIGFIARCVKVTFELA